MTDKQGDIDPNTGYRRPDVEASSKKANMVWFNDDGDFVMKSSTGIIGFRSTTVIPVANSILSGSAAAQVREQAQRIMQASQLGIVSDVHLANRRSERMRVTDSGITDTEKSLGKIYGTTRQGEHVEISAANFVTDSSGKWKISKELALKFVSLNAFNSVMQTRFADLEEARFTDSKDQAFDVELFKKMQTYDKAHANTARFNEDAPAAQGAPAQH